MAFSSLLFLSVMYLTTVKGQNTGSFCDFYTNNNISCFSAPSDCSSRDDCEMSMTAVDNNATFMITLTGKSEGWVAIGFSGDRMMGQDDVIMCIYDGSEVTLHHRFNMRDAKINIPGTDLGDDLVLVSQSYSQGVISCTFDRTESVDGAIDAFGLDGSTWYGLFGRGPVSNGQPRIHFEFPWVSNVQIDLASGDKIEVSRKGGDPTPPAGPPTTSPGDNAGVTTPTSVGVKINTASVAGTFLLMLVCILFA